jgi:hypothetical protein
MMQDKKHQKKGNYNLQQAMKGQRVNRGIALLFTSALDSSE